MMRALAIGPGARRALTDGAEGSLEIALGAGGYVRLGESGWVLLGGARAVMGPLTLAVSGLGGLRAQVGWPARVEGGLLVVGPHQIGLHPQPRPRVAPPGVVEVDPPAAQQPRPRRFARGVVELLEVVAGPPAPSLAAGVDALVRCDHPSAVALLAGRGDGLTPAGDDVLAGYAGWLAATGTPISLSALAADRSPPVALAYLRCAERGELPEPALRFLAAPDARRARVLRDSWGASSGRALMWGFAAAAQAQSSNGRASASSSASFAPSPIWV